jgi:hypothetical protein
MLYLFCVQASVPGTRISAYRFTEIQKNGEGVMSDLYYELLVKKERTLKDTVIRYGMITLIVILVLGGLMLTPVLLLPALIVGVAAYFIFPYLDVEFEYLYVNGEIDVDRVFAKTKRKKAGSFSIREADLAAPLHSHRMDYYNGNTKIKVIDYSSGNDEHARYAVIGRKDNELCKFIIEPDERILTAMQQTAPSKVFLA